MSTGARSPRCSTLAESYIERHGYWLARTLEDLAEADALELAELERRALLSDFYDEIARGKKALRRETGLQRP